MALIFYILQLLSPYSYTGMGLQPPVFTSERVYRIGNTEVSPEHYEAEKTCLARVAFNESRNEPLKGIQMVVQVTLNRTRSPQFPNTVCGAMKAKGAYSFYNPKSKKVDKIRKYPIEYTHIAEEALAGKYDKLISPSVLYFKVCSVESEFFSKLVMVSRVKSHCFYRQRDKLMADN
jgi:spore germination cell wall hydrolase CwlJ-like protein